MNVHKCHKHGAVEDKGIAGRCPVCAGDRYVTVHISPESLNTPTDPAAAIIAAAEALVDHWNEQLGEMRGASVESQDLRTAIRAYRQSRQPQGVAPSEVPIGARFRFVKVGCDGGAMDAGEFTMVGDSTFGRRFAKVGSQRIMCFHPDDRILPIEN